ncbi:diaminopimelate epimerase [Wenzhouxiangella sp. AB-CW3]|uniref:diaminopimelate epimerase n=1 Tax=Wenzhouxiangella sp. AB-CW3 TaxID=2771012 RepID=UPI00168ADE95|nr:diaminopimelate epimerase [Wenzhouxiangella sp. AB-CW3]QOC23647.1 diaminopimelate epimerase [Wenzhouxiangella sp. AB-CW3]
MSRRSRIAFTKLEALGNDFVLIDARSTSIRMEPSRIEAMSDRRRGIGFDQLLLLRPPADPECMCHVEIYNSDGSSAEQCGNGMRAVALWLHRLGEFDSSARIETLAGPVTLTWQGADRITATLPPPDFSPRSCGLDDDGEFPVTLQLDNQRFEVLGAAMGNPHLVMPCREMPDASEVEQLGSRLGSHPALARGANVGFALVSDPHRLHLQVHERGAGLTPACGSGACAAATALIRTGALTSPVEVVQPGGTLVIDWSAEGDPVAMTGPASKVFEGVIAWAT